MKSRQPVGVFAQIIFVTSLIATLAAAEWLSVDVAKNPFLIPGSVESKPSRYEQQGCAFQAPHNSGTDSPFVGAGVPSEWAGDIKLLPEFIAAAGAAEREYGFRGTRNLAERSAVVTALGGRGADVLRKVHRYQHVLVSGSAGPQLRLLKETGGLEGAAVRMVDCYHGSPRQFNSLRGRLECLQDLERHMEPATLIVAAATASRGLQGLSLFFAALYPAVVSDLLSEIRRVARRDDAVSAKELKRVKHKLGAFAKVLEEALAQTYQALVPLPFTRGPKREKFRNPAIMAAALEEYASMIPVSGKAGVPTPLKLAGTRLRAVHEEQRNPLVGAIRGYLPRAADVVHEDDRRLTMTARSVLPVLIGLDRATVSVIFPQGRVCKVRGENLCGFLTRNGEECSAEVVLGTARHCKYTCNSRGGVVHSVQRVVQSLVEEYYFRAASAALAEARPVLDVIAVLQRAKAAL